jgi:hypothetical protein
METHWGGTLQHFVCDMFLFALCGTISLTTAAGVRAFAQNVDTTKSSPSHQQDISIGDSLRRAGSTPLHILYLHGIGAVNAGGSAVLRKKICDYLKDCTNPEGEIRRPREYADVEDFDLSAPVPAMTYLGKDIWKTPEEWHASAPFVDHYEIKRRSGKSILLDELNWWPLTISLKCRQILKDEAQLAGTDAAYLRLCSKTVKASTSDRFDSYDWLYPDTPESLQRKHSQAASINRGVKIGLMDWGMSDALLAVGPMQTLLIESIRQLLVKSVAASGDESKALSEQVSENATLSDSEYIVISHSLGSFLVFSALNSQMHSTTATTASQSPPAVTPRVTGAFTYVLRHTGQAYFFANQVSLLELAMLGSATSSGVPANLAIDLAHWGDVRTKAGGSKPQIVAWSDPDDLLSWHVPDIQGINVVNLDAKNAFRWFGLFAGPLAPHDNYASNKKIIKTLLNPKTSQ